MSTVAGCGLFDDDSKPAPQPDALQPLLDEALRLAASYDRTIVAEPALRDRLSPLADDHRAHAAELAAVIGVTAPSAAPSAAAGDTPTLASLRKSEQAAQKTAAAACRTAPSDRAALTGSIAAARAAHAEALR
ncbi:hypothetical protein BG844_32035 [Couchioplanes caeruleus subsp. caeruleus]|uniref:DUF4439 domain-containing protein n=1 Tax=Couchioplanes caeruleus subsp. caeruleus TaxID=56427 RepID=A0A1K0FZI9_9ACTN|nr:hypothetical protein BG844_32035 [Couchioplanes caeruleus subsp. caeruleus]